MKNTAYNLFKSGRLVEAMRAFGQLCRQAPADAEAWMMLGVTEAQLGQLQHAIPHLQKATSLNPGHGPAWSNLGLALLNANRLADARTCLLKAIEINPEDANAFINLGGLYRQTGDPNAAIYAYSTATRLQPRNAQAHNNLGGVLQGLCRYDEAIVSLKRALKLDPGYADAEFNLGSALQSDGRHDQAEYHYGRALKLNPDLLNARAALASIKEKEGKFSEALKILKPYMRGAETPFPVLLTYTTVARRTGATDEAIALLESVISRVDLSQIDRQNAEYALGDILNQVADYERAFRHYSAANKLRAYSYSTELFERDFQKIIESFPPGSIPPVAQGAHKKGVIMIVGMPRSGTSLVEQILSSHPAVHGGGELPFAGNLVTEFSSRLNSKYPDIANRMDESMLAQLGNAYKKEVCGINPGARFVTDKMPHNFLYLGLFARALPDMKIVHCRRNPLDVCLSIYFHNFNANHPYTTDLRNLGHYYSQYEKLMAHWKLVLGNRLQTIAYEDLLADQENMSRNLINHCGLEWDEQCLEFHKSKRIVNTPSYDQVRKPLYRSSQGRWRNYEKFIGPLVESLGCG